LNCPICTKKESKVIESRESSDSIRRRRACLECNHRFTTYEKIHTNPVTVIKRDWSKQPFSMKKLEKSVEIACTKRPIKRESINKILFEVEKDIYSDSIRQIESKKIGEMVINKLRALDSVAYMRFASVYKDFKNLGNFEKELKTLKK
jgi:transcriptional repressor NrdR